MNKEQFIDLVKLLAVLYIRVNKFYTEKLALTIDEC